MSEQVKRRNTRSGRSQGIVGRTFIIRKLDNWVGYLFAALCAIFVGYLASKGMIAGLGFLGLMLGIGLAMVCVSNAELALYVIAAFSFFASFFSRLLFKGELPTGALFDLLIVAAFIGLLITRPAVKSDFRKFSGNPLVIFIFFTLLYNAVQFVNPNAMSMGTNILALRKFVGYLLLMFIAYSVFDTYSKARRYVKYIFFIATASGLYGCIQEFHGYFDFEMQLILADPHSFGLLFIGGNFRKFSTMSDPSSFGILMAVCVIFFLIHALDENRKVQQFTLFAGAIIMTLGMSFSGTRTAYATIIAGIFFFILLTFDKKKTRIFSLVFSIVFAFLLFGPFYGGSTIARFRTTFMGTKDESYNVRVLAREFVQPYIRSHPIGGGLGTTGFSGAAEHPGHYLANFQPDSSYVKRAAETGWIGLAIICVLYFLTLKAGLSAYFAATDPKLKVLAAACVTSLFAFYVAEFAQVAIGGVSDVVVYYPILAIILKLKYYEAETDKSVLG